MSLDINTLKRPCFCCEGEDGSHIAVGSWSIAGIGKLDLTIRICSRCGAVLQDPVLNEKAMEFYYKNYSNYTNPGRGGLPSDDTLETDFRQISIIQKFLNPSRVFEIGCATGNLLSKLKKVGWDVDGCDPSKTAADIAAKLWGINIQIGLFDDLSLDMQSTDLVIISHVLEHIFKPLSTLKRVHNILSSEGHLLVEVPCLTNPEKWPNGYFTFEHINIFSKNILINCLLNAGFEPIYIDVKKDHSPYPVILILAKKSNHHSWQESKIDSPAQVKILIDEYLKSESSEWDRVDKLLINELKGFDKVIIWGGGIHTSQLFENTKALSNKKVISIIDSDPQKKGLNIFGIKIDSPDSIFLKEKNVAVVISSHAFENEIYDILSGGENLNAKIIRLYQRKS